MTRRRTLLVAGLAALPAALLARYLVGDAGAAIAAVLHKRLDYLQLDPDGVRAFARDAIATGDVAPAKLRAAAASGLLYFEPDGRRGATLFNSFLRGEDRIVTQFLLSSDFFQNGADTTRVVRYLGHYDPRRTACANWFARFADDGESGA